MTLNDKVSELWGRILHENFLKFPILSQSRTFHLSYDLHDWTSNLLSVGNLRAHCVDLDKVKGKGFPNKLWRLIKGLEYWASIHTLAFGTTGTAEMSAARSVLTLPTRKFLGGYFRWRVNGTQGYWMRSEEFGHLTVFQGPFTNCTITRPREFW